jgi:phosphonopyruvate decarboxylase
MMKSDKCLEVLAQHHTDQIVVAAFQAAFEWMVIKPSDLNYLFVGAMGQAASHALGLALGRPDKRVIVLDGDGSLLMNLGTLVTIGSVAPENLIHFVCENGTYEVNGAHPVPGAGQADFAALAEAAGYREVYVFSALADFDRRIADILKKTGPLFVDLKVEKGADYPLDYDALFSGERRRAFKDALMRS